MRLGLGLGLTERALVTGLLPETAILLAAMSVQPDEARIDVINDYIRALKSAGVWAKIDVICRFAAHNATDALLNWKNPGIFNATLVNAPTFTEDRCFTTNGVDNYIETNFNPSTAGGHYTQNSASAGYWDLHNESLVGLAMGWYDGTDGLSINPRSGGNAFAYRINSGVERSFANESSIGLNAVDRPNSADIVAYRNGVAATSTRTSTALNNATFRIGSASATSFRVVEAASAFIGGSLTATEHAALYAAELAYMTAVGAA